MNLSRRSFLGLLGAGTAAMVLDPEALLWRPGQRTIFIPKPARVIASAALRPGDVFTVAGRFAINPLTLEPVQTRSGLRFPQQFVVTEDVRAGQEILARSVCPHIATHSRDKDWETDSRCEYFNGQPLAPGDHVAKPVESLEATYKWIERRPGGPERGFTLEPPASAFRPELRARLLKGAVG